MYLSTFLWKPKTSQIIRLLNFLPAKVLSQSEGESALLGYDVNETSRFFVPFSTVLKIQFISISLLPHVITFEMWRSYVATMAYFGGNRLTDYLDYLKHT